MRLSKVSTLFLYRVFKTTRYLHLVVLKVPKLQKINRSAIRFSTQDCTDINIITNVLVFVQCTSTVCMLLKKEKNYLILCALDFIFLLAVMLKEVLSIEGFFILVLY